MSEYCHVAFLKYCQEKEAKTSTHTYHLVSVYSKHHVSRVVSRTLKNLGIALMMEMGLGIRSYKEFITFNLEEK